MHDLSQSSEQMTLRYSGLRSRVDRFLEKTSDGMVNPVYARIMLKAKIFPGASRG